MSGGSRFFVERSGEDQGTQKKNPEMSNTAAGKARRGAQVSASSEVGDVADLPRAHGGGRGDAVPGGDGPARASRRVCRAGAGRPAACPKPRWRAFGADAPPLLRSRKGGNDIRRTLHFSHFARGGGWRGRAFRCRGRARSWPSTVDAPFRFRASGEHVPYGLVLFLRVEGRGRHDVTDRAKRRDARPEFSRVRSDSLPAGQPSRVRWGPSAPPLQELRATGRGPSRERADAVRGRTLRRPRFPATMRRRKSVGQRSSADRSLCATVFEYPQGHILPFFKTR